MCGHHEPKLKSQDKNTTVTLELNKINATFSADTVNNCTNFSSILFSSPSPHIASPQMCCKDYVFDS